MKRAAAGLLLAGGLALTACGSSGTQGVVVTTAASRTISAHPGGTGAFAASVDVPVSLGYRGSVTRVDVVLGQTVTAGQPLLGIASDELARSVDELAVRKQTDEATLATLQAALGGLASRADAAAAQRAKIAAQQARVDLDARLLDVAQGKTDVLRAPAAGVVASVAAVPGMTFGASTPLLHLVDATAVTVDAQVPVSYRGQVEAGDPVELTAVGAPQVHVTGTVVGVSPLAAQNGQTFVVSARADNPDGLAVPGMSAYARFDVTEDVPVAVNRLAVRNADEQPSVLVVDGDRVQLRPVRLGMSDDGATQVVDGLSAGEQVVLTGAQSLQDGDRVRVEKSEPPS